MCNFVFKFFMVYIFVQLYEGFGNEFRICYNERVDCIFYVDYFMKIEILYVQICKFLLFIDYRLLYDQIVLNYICFLYR